MERPPTQWVVVGPPPKKARRIRWYDWIVGGLMYFLPLPLPILGLGPAFGTLYRVHRNRQNLLWKDQQADSEEKGE